MGSWIETNKTRIIFVGIIFVAVAAVIFAFLQGRQTGIQAQLEGVPLVLVKGEVTQIESFQFRKNAEGGVTSSHKFLVEVVADEVEILQEGFVGDNVPQPGDVVRFDSPDSRINLLVNATPQCEADGTLETGEVTVCTYEVRVPADQNSLTGSFVVMEEVGSTGLPEYIGTTK